MSTPVKNETVTATVAPEKNKQLAATVPSTYHAAFDALHWDRRVKVADLVREALDDYVAKHNINVSGAKPE